MSERKTRRLPNWGTGLIAIGLVVLGFYLAFAKSLPFSGDGYQLKAVFSDAQNIRANSPVRIAGVDVGKVTGVEHLTDGNGNGLDAAVITMSLEEDALPIREDATMQLRPRLFLEGNLFVDMQPGSPAGDELDPGSVIPMEQTASSVQFDQVLTSLQAPVRDSLQVFLKEFGDGLDRYGGAEGFRELFRTSPAAFGATAQVNEALLGTQPGDLTGVIRNLGATVEALDRNEVQLQDLVTNFRIVTGSFAAESAALEQGIAELPGVLEAGRPALAKLNAAFPALRAFAREALPGVQAADKALDEANPFLAQLRGLVSKPELRGLVKDLRPTIPELANLAKTTVPFFEQARALSSCFNNVVIPWSNTDVPAANFPAEEVYKETGYGIAGVAGESRTGDANGQALRVLGGGGTNTLSLPPIDLGDGSGEQPLAGAIPFELIGAQPAKQTAAKTPFRPDMPCENQEPPDLNTGAVPDPSTSASAGSAGAPIPGTEAIVERYAALTEEFKQVGQLQREGDVKGADLLLAALRDQLKTLTKTDLPAYQDALADFTGTRLGGGS
jgi:virulence factor Mce-like protein